MFNLEISSYRGSYTVELSSNPIEVLDGDVLVIDKNLLTEEINSLTNNIFVISANEETKTLGTVNKLLGYLINTEFQKSNRIVCVGGGVVQDIVSFTSSILFRGVDWVFYPTTLLSQCDSCIGSKTSINFDGVKNLLGGFHPPRKIFINTEFLNTLPEREIKSGIGEMLHYFIISDEIELSKEIVDDQAILENIEKYIHRSLSIKKSMIEKDEFDKNERNIFNYGHTFGHALEKLTDYQINHGQAVTYGMRIANKISLNLGLIDKVRYSALDIILEKNMPDFFFTPQTIETYLGILKKDKKNIDGDLTCILLSGTEAKKLQVPYEKVRRILENECA